ncbi:hypothetical protein FB451DRAFT_1404298 [Mycena latifolia]|nr:hypothetical protein FB451DRAFT_1404298 [Mycena latifolia]
MLAIQMQSQRRANDGGRKVAALIRTVQLQKSARGQPGLDDTFCACVFLRTATKVEVNVLKSLIQGGLPAPLSANGGDNDNTRPLKMAKVAKSTKVVHKTVADLPSMNGKVTLRSTSTSSTSANVTLPAPSPSGTNKFPLHAHAVSTALSPPAMESAIANSNVDLIMEPLIHLVQGKADVDADTSYYQTLDELADYLIRSPIWRSVIKDIMRDITDSTTDAIDQHSADIAEMKESIAEMSEEQAQGLRLALSKQMAAKQQVEDVESSNHTMLIRFEELLAEWKITRQSLHIRRLRLSSAELEGGQTSNVSGLITDEEDCEEAHEYSGTARFFRDGIAVKSSSAPMAQMFGSGDTCMVQEGEGEGGIPENILQKPLSQDMMDHEGSSVERPADTEPQLDTTEESTPEDMAGSPLRIYMQQCHREGGIPEDSLQKPLSEDMMDYEGSSVERPARVSYIYQDTECQLDTVEESTTVRIIPANFGLLVKFIQEEINGSPLCMNMRQCQGEGGIPEDILQKPLRQDIVEHEDSSVEGPKIWCSGKSQRIKKPHGIVGFVIFLLLLPFALGLVFPSLTSPVLVHVFARDNQRLRVVRDIRRSRRLQGSKGDLSV